MIKDRNIDEENMLIRIGLDSGAGFFKVCLSIFDLRDTKQSGRLDARFKDSGIKKVMVIGIVPEIQENYFKRLWLEMSIDKLSRSFAISTDLKLCNILLGLLSHSSHHPCCWCNVDKGNLDA